MKVREIQSLYQPPETPCEASNRSSRVVRSVKNQDNWFDAIGKWESSFECSECGNNSYKRFKYERSVANGEVWICKNKKCGAELIVDHQPNEDDF